MTNLLEVRIGEIKKFSETLCHSKINSYFCKIFELRKGKMIFNEICITKTM